MKTGHYLNAVYMYVGLVQVHGKLIGHAHSCNYPVCMCVYVCVCTAELCSWSHQFVHVLYVHDCSKIFSEQTVFYYLLTEFNTSSVVCYVQQAVQTEQFMLFQI